MLYLSQPRILKIENSKTIIGPLAIERTGISSVIGQIGWWDNRVSAEDEWESAEAIVRYWNLLLGLHPEELGNTLKLVMEGLKALAYTRPEAGSVDAGEILDQLRSTLGQETPEYQLSRLDISTTPDAVSGYYCLNVVGYRLAWIWGEANAKRMAHCWNACRAQGFGENAEENAAFNRAQKLLVSSALCLLKAEDVDPKLCAPVWRAANHIVQSKLASGSYVPAIGSAVEFVKLSRVVEPVAEDNNLG